MSSRLNAIPHCRKLCVTLAIERQVKQSVADGRPWSAPLLDLADKLHACGISHLAHRNLARAGDFFLAGYLIRWRICGDGDFLALLFGTHLVLTIDCAGSPDIAMRFRTLLLRRFLSRPAAGIPASHPVTLH